MPAGHLIARLKLSLGRDEDLDHLHHAWGQFVAALKLLDLVFETALQLVYRVVVLPLEGFELVVNAGILDDDLAPLSRRELGEKICRFRLPSASPHLSDRQQPSDSSGDHSDAHCRTRPKWLFHHHGPWRDVQSRTAQWQVHVRLFNAATRNTRTSTTVPSTPGGTLSEVSRTSEAFSPKIARSSFSSGVIGDSPLA